MSVAPAARVPGFSSCDEGGDCGTSTCTAYSSPCCGGSDYAIPSRIARGPRLHDLRHSFAVNTILRWYRAGEDVERLLPTLTTYLGHSKVRDTYWYLSACPELMGEAASRLEARWETVS